MVIHHIGLVVKNIEEHYEKYFRDSLGYDNLSQIYIDDKIGVKVAFINMNDKIFLEFVEPLDEKSPVNNYLKKRGQTLHHLCFEVEDIEVECANLRGKNYLITMPPTPAIAFDGRRVVFLMAKEEDFLIELLETK
jgi:methylmalonyl-CoA/ethylmalonyl-CoA epimerase